MTSKYSDQPGPTLAQIEAASLALDGRIVDTPMVTLGSNRIVPFLPEGADVRMKLELFQQAGSFKARGALLAIDALDDAGRRNGVTAVSAGNHALAVAFAARSSGVSAKLVMPEYADPVRVEGCRAMGAEVVLTPDIHTAFTKVEEIRETEDRAFLHPFDSEYMTLGAATCGAEINVAKLDAVIVPVGGGGLISGISRAVKLIAPECAVYGVEPYGAASMYQSFAAGEAVSIPKVDTIADSLGSPVALPYSYGIARAHVDEIVRITDDEMLRAMVLLFDALKIAAEPACAAATAALIGPLKERLVGKRVGVIACGSNIGEDKFSGMLKEGRSLVG